MRAKYTKPAKPARLTRVDVKRFVAGESDFAFEMKVQKTLRDLGFEIEHGGAYQDPVTGVVRQFDIRAWKHSDAHTLGLAVECKNLHQSTALLVSTVPRTEREAFHSVIKRHTGPMAFSTVDRMVNSALYLPGQAVGKSSDHVRRDKSGKELLGGDRDTFERMNQAIHSCRDLCERFVSATQKPLHRMVVPVMVVPARRLWQVDYDEGGARISAPRTVKHVSFYLSHEWGIRNPIGGQINYLISHVEILTADNLRVPTERLLSDLLLDRV